MLHRQRGVRGRSVRNNLVNTKGRGRDRGGSASKCKGGYSSAAHGRSVVCGEPMEDQVYHEGLQPIEGPTLGQGRCEEKGVAERS